MFGAFRFGLALLVVAGHLRQPIWLGAWAVFAFYTISGYLMCLVLNERYGFSRRGFGAYALNRLLRIHPPYWLACAATLGVMLVAGEATTRNFWGPWELPTSAAEWGGGTHETAPHPLSALDFGIIAESEETSSLNPRNLMIFFVRI